MSIIYYKGIVMQRTKIITARPTNLNLFGFKYVGIKIEYMHFGITFPFLHSYPSVVNIYITYHNGEDRNSDLAKFEKISRSNKFQWE